MVVARAEQAGESSGRGRLTRSSSPRPPEHGRGAGHCIADPQALMNPKKPKKGEAPFKPTRLTVSVAAIYPAWQRAVAETLQKHYDAATATFAEERVLLEVFKADEVVKKQMKRVMPFAGMLKVRTPIVIPAPLRLPPDAPSPPRTRASVRASAATPRAGARGAARCGRPIARARLRRVGGARVEPRVSLPDAGHPDARAPRLAKRRRRCRPGRADLCLCLSYVGAVHRRLGGRETGTCIRRGHDKFRHESDHCSCG